MCCVIEVTENRVARKTLTIGLQLVFIHYDIAPARSCAIVVAELIEFKLQAGRHSPYSPGLVTQCEKMIDKDFIQTGMSLRKRIRIIQKG